MYHFCGLLMIVHAPISSLIDTNFATDMLPRWPYHENGIADKSLSIVRNEPRRKLATLSLS